MTADTQRGDLVERRPLVSAPFDRWLIQGYAGDEVYYRPRSLLPQADTKSGVEG